MAAVETVDAFASATQMEARSLGAITAATHPYLDSELLAATRLIRGYCRWHVAPSKQVKHVRRGRDRDRVWLQAMQITAVDAVTVDGTVYDEDQLAGVEFDPDTGWTNIEGRSVEVDFTAGYAEVPEDIVSLTLQIAARALGAPLGIVREQAGTVSVAYTQVGFNQAGGTLLLPAEEAVLTPYRIGRLP